MWRGKYIRSEILKLLLRNGFGASKRLQLFEALCRAPSLDLLQRQLQDLLNILIPGLGTLLG